MSDYSDLKLIAEACEKHQPLRFMRSHGALYIRNDNGIVFDVHQNRSFPDFMAQNKDYADLVLAASPTAVLALIAENDELKEKYEASRDRKNSITLLKMQNDHLRSDLREMTKFKEHMVELREAHGFDSWAAALVEVDKLRAEVERVKSFNNQQFGDAIRKNAEIEAFKRGMVGDYDLDAWLEFSTGAVQRDADRLRWLRRHEFDIGSYHGVQEHNHQAWFEHISDESIDRCIADEAEFAAQFEVKS